MNIHPIENGAQRIFEIPAYHIFDPEIQTYIDSILDSAIIQNGSGFRRNSHNSHNSRNLKRTRRRIHRRKRSTRKHSAPL